MINDPVRVGGGLGAYASSNRSERTMSEVVKDIVGNVQEMLRSEVRLARVELREEFLQAAGAGKLIVAGAGMAAAGGAFLLVTVALLLALVMPMWAATLIVGAVLGIAGMTVLSRGRAQFKIPLPDKTIENVKENVEWMQTQSKS
jgi:uncharacterized membrane protein YqjE